MEDRRFDALARALATGSSRRAALKALFGAGGIIIGSRLHDADAARRRPTPVPGQPTPVPLPAIKCPGAQVPCGDDCCCPDPTDTKCGPACCPDAGSQCCDGACCQGVCYGEELCCEAPLHAFCEDTQQCCDLDEWCCPGWGCVSNGNGSCCSVEDCPIHDCYSVICGADHTCQYTYDCHVDDGEGAPCCGEGHVCTESGECCTPNCPLGLCGFDGCGAICACGDGESCVDGLCFQAPENCVETCAIYECLALTDHDPCICAGIAIPSNCEAEGCPDGQFCVDGNTCVTRCP